MNSAPRTTTLLGGLGLALVGVLELLPIALNWFPSAYDLQSVFRSAPAQGVHLVVLLATCVILAFGVSREGGIVGSSRLGRVALLLVGLAFPIERFVSFGLFIGGVDGTEPGFVVGTVLQVLPIAAVSVAAVVVARVHVLEGFARWILIGCAGAQVFEFVFVAVLATVPNAAQSPDLAVLDSVTALPPLLLLAAGVGLAFDGRSGVVKQQLRAVYTQWRLTT